MRLIIDAGPLVAAGDCDSDRHRQCTQAITGTRPPRYVPDTVVIAAEPQFLDLLAGGFLTPVALTAEDYRRAAQLVRHRADLPLGGVDASLVALAERLNITELVTIDRHHFTVVRPRHAPAFHLFPELG